MYPAQVTRNKNPITDMPVSMKSIFRICSHSFRCFIRIQIIYYKNKCINLQNFSKRLGKITKITLKVLSEIIKK